MARQRLGHRLEDGIAGRMAMRIIDRFEIIDIDVNERGAGVVALDIGERARQLPLEAVAIENVEQRIDIDLRLQLHQLRLHASELRLQGCELGLDHFDFRHKARDGR